MGQEQSGQLQENFDYQQQLNGNGIPMNNNPPNSIPNSPMPGVYNTSNISNVKRKRDFGQDQESVITQQVMNNKNQQSYTNTGVTINNTTTQQQQSGSLIYSAEIDIKKKVKANNYKDVSLKMYYTKDLENILPEKWGNQSGSLKSSIELLGSASLKNYEKSDILKKLAQSSKPYNGMSEQDKASSLQNSYKLNQISSMLSTFPKEYVNVTSVSTDQVDEKNRKYIKLQMNANNEVANLLVKQFQQNKTAYSSGDEFHNLYKNMGESKSSFNNDSQSTNVHSKCSSKQYMNQFMGVCSDSDDDEQGTDVVDNNNDDQGINNVKVQDSKNLTQLMELENSKQLNSSQNRNNNQNINGNSSIFQSENLCGSDQLQQMQ